MNDPQPDIEARVQSAVDGNVRDLVFLLQFYRKTLLADITSLTSTLPADLKSAIEPEDLLQDTYTCIVQDLKKFTDTGNDAFLRWIRIIARNRCTDAIRRARAAKRGGTHKKLATGWLSQVPRLTWPPSFRPPATRPVVRFHGAKLSRPCATRWPSCPASTGRSSCCIILKGCRSPLSARVWENRRTLFRK